MTQSVLTQRHQATKESVCPFVAWCLRVSHAVPTCLGQAGQEEKSGLCAKPDFLLRWLNARA